MESAESNHEDERFGLRKPLVAGPRRQDMRIHQSVTYSPVSHCVTRDNANIFEKKKQRMAKIQKLRGVSNHSETDKNMFMCSSATNLTSNFSTIENKKNMSNFNIAAEMPQQV